MRKELSVCHYRVLLMTVAENAGTLGSNRSARRNGHLYTTGEVNRLCGQRHSRGQDSDSKAPKMSQRPQAMASSASISTAVLATTEEVVGICRRLNRLVRERGIPIAKIKKGKVDSMLHEVLYRLELLTNTCMGPCSSPAHCKSPMSEKCD